MLEIKDLKCGYEKIILEEISFKADQGDFICILGANGSGKSTLIKTIVGLVPSLKGQVLIRGENIDRWSWSQRAKKISYIPQSFTSTFQYKALDIVLMGRTSHLSLSASPKEEDILLAERAMEQLNILHLKDKIFSQMSGGERQLVKIAQALAQEAKILIMDEPTNNLDFGNQIIMLNYLKECSQDGMIVIMATHYPDQALTYANKVILLQDGKNKIINNPKEDIRGEDLGALYNIEMGIFDLEVDGHIRKVSLPV